MENLSDKPDYYRAAYLGAVELTGPEHAHLTDAELIAEAEMELDRLDPDHETGALGLPLAPRDQIRIILCSLANGSTPDANSPATVSK